MATITGIKVQQKDPDRLNIYIDGAFCAGVRKRTFQAMNLKVGDEICCEQLREQESFFWKQTYQSIWKNEKVRIAKVVDLIKGLGENVLADVTGFGADTEVLIKEHPGEKGMPDIDIRHGLKPEKTILKVEVTGTERMRGKDYWVRPDKIAYAENHPEEDVWIILHFAEPRELFAFIQPVKGKIYQRHTIEIRGAGEVFCLFSDSDEEVKSLKEFSEHLRSKLEM